MSSDAIIYGMRKAKYGMDGQANLSTKPVIGSDCRSAQNVPCTVVSVEDVYDFDDALSGWRVGMVPRGVDPAFEAARAKAVEIADLEHRLEVLFYGEASPGEDRDATRAEIVARLAALRGA